MSDFDFVSDKTLLSNIDQADGLILELLLLTDSEGYKEKPALISSLRKTIIIYAATIVEALLLWKLKKACSSGEIELGDEWNYKDPHKIVDQTDGSEIVWLRREKVKKKLEKIDFVHLIKVCSDKSILSSEKFVQDVDQVRKLRNNLHIGGLHEVERSYTPEDLEFCFSVLENVKRSVSKSEA